MIQTVELLTLNVRRNRTLINQHEPRVSSTSNFRRIVIPDAAGYIDVFTEEGIAWAIASAQAVFSTTEFL